ncbi:MAG: DUF4440 domain-containing protein [Reichenbachiella sp.]|uniref:DUF4440 domain-containing protein n=1 Tax=Reichenbachiella sp. TaxID=2184521 RepID=UPI003265D3F0
MKHLLAIVLLFASSASTMAQVKPTPEEEQAAKQLIIDIFQDLLSDFDSTKVETHLTSDFLLLEHGEVWNNDTIKNYIRKALIYPDSTVRNNRFEFIKFEKSGDMIWLAYDNYAYWTKNGNVVGRMHWLESAVAVKKGSGWKLKMMHSTRIQNE